MHKYSVLLRLGLTVVLSAMMFSAAPAQKEGNWVDLDRIVGNVKIVNFREDSHFLTGVHQHVAQMFEHLVEEKGFRVFVFEAAWNTEEAFADFMKSDRTTLTPEESFYLNAFNSKAIVEMMIWIRDWNRKHLNDKIRVTGFQPEQPVTDFNALWDFAGKSEKFAAANLKSQAAVCRSGTGEFKTNIEFIVDTSKRRRNNQLTYTTEERAACNQAINAIDAFIEQNKKELIKKNSLNAYLEAGAHITSLRTYVNTLTYVLDQSVINKKPTKEEGRALQRKAYGEGDKARFEIFEILRKTRFKDKKIFFWMHNWHAMKHSDETEVVGADDLPSGTISVGTRMAAAYGKNMVVIGNMVPKVNCKLPRCSVPDTPDSLETKFAQRFGNSPALVDLRNPPASDKDLPINSVGSLFANVHEGHFENVVLSRQFDAIYYLPESGVTFEEQK